MLSVHRTITVYGRSIIDGTEVEGYQATIDEQKPDDIAFNSWQIDPILYKKNRLVCRIDRSDFEDRVYKYQEKMMKEDSEVDGGSTETPQTAPTTEPTQTSSATTGDGMNG